MNIKYWTNFSKRKNSTKQPTGGTQATVRLKEPCGIASPSFICNGIPDNVKYIEAFGRFYFVSEVTHDGPDIVIDCVSDPMATFKSAIGSYNGYIEYASSVLNHHLNDPRNNPTDLVNVSYNTMAFNDSIFNTTGCYILGVLSDDTNGEGGFITYFACDKTAIHQLSLILYDQTFIQQLIDQFQAVQDSLVSCLWIPVDISKISGSNEYIKVGREQTIVTGKKITSRKLATSTGSVALTFPAGCGGAGSNMLYIDKAPYTTGVLFLPFVGIVPIDLDLIAFTKSLQININIDVLTGDIVYRLSTGGALVSSYNGNIATKMPLSSATFDAAGAATGALTTIGGVIGGILTTVGTEGVGAALGVLGAATSAIAGGAKVAKSLEFHTMINGSASSAIGAELGIVPYYYIATYQPTMTPGELKAEQGLPLFDVDTVSNRPGFLKFNCASISINGFESDRETINGYLNSGFYYE